MNTKKLDLCIGGGRNIFSMLAKVCFQICMIGICLLIGCQSNQERKAGTHINYSTTPATKWQHAMVSGNGVQGIMVMGNPKKERIILNHEFCYEFLGTEDYLPPNYSNIVNDIKQLHLERKYLEADNLFKKTLEEKGFPGMLITDPYHPAATLVIEQDFNGEAQNYCRSTNYTNGELQVKWDNGKAEYKRASFVSRPDDVIVTRIESSQEGDVNVSLCLENQFKLEVNEDKTWSNFIDDNIKRMYPDRLDELNTPLVHPVKQEVADNWMTFRVQYQIYDRGYEVISQVRNNKGTIEVKDGKIVVADANSVDVLTKVVFLEKFDDSQLETEKRNLNELSTYTELLTKHEKVHGEIFGRVKLNLDKTGFTDGANEELIAWEKNNDAINPYLLEKVFNMGLYGLLSSSGKNPPNLVGMWTGEWRPIWSGDFTTDANVNLQISAANLAGMKEAIEAYTQMLERIAPDWEVNAKYLFNCRGYCAGSRTSGRRNFQSHVGKWGIHAWTAGAAWLLYPCYEYVLCSGDIEFLEKRLLPMMDKTALFFEDFLDTYDENGNFLISPSWSPENLPANQKVRAVANATMDIAVIRQLLGYMIYEYEKRGIQPERVANWKKILEKLPPYLINNDGALKEWARDDVADNYNHRHVSHLYGAWPGFEFTPEETPELFKAANIALEKRERGDGSAHGAMITALHAARLKRADLVYENLSYLLENGYFYRSLVTSHNPENKIYNTDALHSLPAVVIESLIYSRPGTIEFLPAWSEKLPKGKIEGVACRTQAVVDFLEWNFQEKELNATITSLQNQKIKLQLRKKIISAEVNGKEVGITGDFIILNFEKDEQLNINVNWE
ncbi:glycoside hydrolase N-terminal domain-containing protein [uncultured Draconibacterium sp.]|uniref:glycosyl hydrolase family 95 catalytic domain-containing protein n=1 Tax=uncultured Draconibacterium sp. TaxID=1573823 RepID=UPI00326178CE